MKPVLIAADTAFPAAPPDDLNDSTVIAHNDWTAFQQVTHMRSHWDRPGWYPGRRAYYWMLASFDQPALIELARRCQDTIAPLGMDSIPPNGLHITMAHIGEDDVPRERIEALADHVTERLPAPFTIEVGPLSGSRGALRFSVAPWEPLVRLHSELAGANRQHNLGASNGTAYFRPHLGIAYNPISRPAGPVIDLVSTLRSQPPVEIAVRSVELVSLRREAHGKNPVYAWDLIRRVSLATPE